MLPRAVLILLLLHFLLHPVKISSSPSAALYTRVFVLEGHACLCIETPGGNCVSRQDSKVCRTQHGARFQASRALDNPLVFGLADMRVWKAHDLLRPCASSKFNKGVSVNWSKQTTRVAASQRIIPDSTQNSSKSHGAMLCYAMLCYAQPWDMCEQARSFKAETVRFGLNGHRHAGSEIVA